MSELMLVVMIIFVGLVAPLWLLLHYITQWKQTRGLSRDDEKMLADLWESANRMEDRMQALEEILDRDNREWRRREP
ncbi:envelope stress response membrane protein PspB [Natronospira bacteriovora]|uniref:Envelope stress response membrane protein PspB n=1 Tax=Natronospira bacteriovora TaxID=3069753 RepID=A0ABU0W8F2_9GAMM|nr:envelope stress response membrane protein PspB [Natronospira sp. AB-CW4]MDQ2070294.1 envelope stress response membrane protein PspB [Natronospira sp. AB-CW4]